ncbi:MAG: hypothetical protein ACOYN0_03690 [Phycisphaerales bacterium]
MWPTSIAFVAAVMTSQESLRPDGAHWSFTVPAGWQLADEAALRRVNDEVAARGVGIAYVGALVCTDAQGPFVLLQVAGPLPPGRRAEAIRRDMGKGFESGVATAKEKLANDVTGMTNTKPEFDESRVQLRTRAEIRNADGSTLGLLSVTHLGKAETVVVHCYAPAPVFDEWQPRFEAVNAAMVFDAGYRYELATPSPVAPSVAGGLGAGLWRGAIIGGVMAVAAGAIVWYRRSRMSPGS